MEEIVRICQTTDILAEYMKSREKEVKNIMFTLYDEEEILRRHDKTVEQRGINIGISQGIITSLRNLLANTGMTQSQAMDALGIEQGERDKYAAMMS